MNVNNDELAALLGALSNAKAPSGFEDETLAVAREFCAGWATFDENTLRDGLVTPRNFTGKKPVLMLDAHGDEVGGMVKAVLSNGTMSFVQLGHFSPGTLAGQGVWVRATDGSWVRGVIGVKPPHFWTEAERASGKAGMILDVGARSREEAVERFHMGMGEPFVPDTTFSLDAERGVAFGKAFDCRAGVCSMLLALRELATCDDLPVDVVASISAQEEVGERGVAAAARHFSPAAAYLFEGCPADDTFTPADEVGAALGKGPMYRYFDVCMITNPRYQRFVLGVAAEQGLPAQTSVREGGGTNAGILHQLDVPSVVAGIPCRYIHAGTSICAPEDIVSAAEIAVAVAERMTPEVLASF
ncbi:MAG TPA: M20/M25/M40 family metallo-hydrolase [Candidatus Olsenella pullicola]|nr:M20/M25/M40 family metallo-hydrolase [Candidatus Olsenella pullicola]